LALITTHIGYFNHKYVPTKFIQILNVIKKQENVNQKAYFHKISLLFASMSFLGVSVKKSSIKAARKILSKFVDTMPIPPTFYEQLIRQFPFAKNVQTQKVSPIVDFINILRTIFLYELCFGSFSLVTCR